MGIDSIVALPRVVQFIRRSAELTADELRLIDEGIVVRTPTVPSWWDLNHVRIARPVKLERALALAEEHLRDLPFRHLVIEDDATGERLEEPLCAEGWKLERDLLMVLGGDSDRPSDGFAVIEPSEDQVVAMMRRWHLEDSPTASSAELAELEQYARLEARSRRERRFGIEGEDGELAAITKLRWDGAIAQVEDVYTVPSERGRGYARALVSAAIALAKERGHELTFIVADDQGWPKQLYRRLGFEPVGRMRNFHREMR